MKQGENEAIEILKKIGISDITMNDDNSNQSMPDLKCGNGRFIEVTHTKHIHNIFDNKYSDLCINEKVEKSENVCNAYGRIMKKDYQMNSDKSMRKLIKKDINIVKEYYGIDVTRGQTSEFKCDFPIIEHSIDNIFNEIINDKGNKYKNQKDVDLFVFITDEEYSIFSEIESERVYNSAYENFTKQILASPFDTIYLCKWDFESQKYFIDDPTLIILRKCVLFSEINNDNIT